MFGSPEWMYSAGGFYPFPIENSCRFNSTSSSHLSYTPASSSNKIWTFSTLVKRCGLGSFQHIFDGSTASFECSLRFDTNDRLELQRRFSGANQVKVTSNAQYRDAGGWYHIVCAVDVDQATAANRVRLYVNGEEVTYLNTTYPPLGYTGMTIFSSGDDMSIGRRSNDNLLHLDGYLAETIAVSGQQLTPDDFGEMKSGVWVPKEYTGTYGTNGFRLDFADGADLGNDVSGNGNDYTPSGLDANDQMLDTPTNNFCVWNPIYVNSSRGEATLSEGNLKTVTPQTGFGAASTTIKIPSTGKWYFEARQSGNFVKVAIAEPTTAFTRDTVDGNLKYNLDGGGAQTIEGGQSGTAIIAIAVDADAKTTELFLNGVSKQTLTYTGKEIAPLSIDASNFRTLNNTYNFGADSSFAGLVTRQGNTDANGIGDFYYAPPAGYLALCSANLPDPVDAINPAKDGSPQDYFSTVIYSGDGTSNRAITGVGFQPDWVWYKTRNVAVSHVLTDSVRGVGFELYSNSDGVETNSDLLGSFDADGFTIASAAQNNASRTYVAWNWKAGAAAVTNTDGTITSQVSAAPEVGFSIVSWASNGTNGTTIGHGLAQAPEIIITKNRDGTNSWAVQYTVVDGSLDLMYLDQTAAAVNDPSRLAPTATVFDSINYTNTNDIISYCFHSVEGFSKIGTYTGNGSADGPFVYCGFRPAYVLIKRTDSTDSWYIQDDIRDPTNVAENFLIANGSNAEAAADILDMLSNGFKLRISTGTSHNFNGGTYLFMAFSSNPFKYSNAR